MTSPLPGVGVFGTGLLTDLMVPFLREAGFAVVAIWSGTLEDASRTASALNIPFSTNRVDDVLLLKEVDLVLVLCPPSLHSQITVKALGIGKHVAVPPPVGINQNEALRMLQAGQYYPSLMAVSLYGLRFLPVFARMRRCLLDEGLVGEVTLCDVRISAPNLIRDSDSFGWACDEHMGGGVLNQFGSQVIDLLHYLTDRKAARVHGSVRTFTKTTDKINGIRQIRSDDFVSFQIESHDNVFYSISVNGCSNAATFSQEVVVSGTKGQLVATPDGALVFQEKVAGNGLDQQVLFQDDDHRLEPCSKEHRRFPSVHSRGSSLLFCHLANSIKASTSGKPAEPADGEPALRGEPVQGTSSSYSSFEDALYVQAVIEAIRLSSKERVWVKVQTKKEASSFGDSITWAI